MWRAARSLSSLSSSSSPLSASSSSLLLSSSSVLSRARPALALVRGFSEEAVKIDDDGSFRGDPYATSYPVSKRKKAGGKKRMMDKSMPIYTAYPPDEMLKIRRRYQNLDFGEMKEAMARADSSFFGREYFPEKVFTGQFIPQSHESPFQEEREKQNQKMLDLLPIRFHILSKRRRYMHAGGVRESCTSVCIGGNGKGVAGYGIGKGPDMRVAALRAKEHLAKNLYYLPMHEQRTLFQDVMGKHNQTFVIFKGTKRGAGLKASNMMFAIMNCFGLSDVTTKILGRRNPITVIYAAFNGLSKTTSYRDIALRMGVNYYRHFEPGYYKETPLSQEELEEQTKTIYKHIHHAEDVYTKHNNAKKAKGVPPPLMSTTEEEIQDMLERHVVAHNPVLDNVNMDDDMYEAGHEMEDLGQDMLESVQEQAGEEGEPPEEFRDSDEPVLEDFGGQPLAPAAEELVKERVKRWEGASQEERDRIINELEEEDFESEEEEFEVVREEDLVF